MGRVYACYDEQLDRKLAVKVLRVEVLRSQQTAAMRLMREAQAMARLSHPNIVTVHEAGEADGMVYVAMEFVPGISLDVWMQKSHPWRTVLPVFIQAGRGLGAAHRASIVHRDFKPQNVMITEDDLVKVLDFGLARVTDGNLSEDWLTTQSSAIERSSSVLLYTLTRTGTTLGTPAYMPPEQHLGEVATAASDQFSFCVSLYQALYGLLPFSTKSLDILREEVLAGTVAPPPPRSQVPSRIFQALRKGMSPDPAHRFGSMAELLTTLERDPLRRFWQVATLAGTVAVTGAVSITAMGASEVEVCPDARAELVEIWDIQPRATLETSLQAKAPDDARKLLALVEPRLDTYAADWTQMRNEACLAHAEGRQSPQLFDLRTSCLDRRRASLAATVDAVANVESTSLDTAIKAVLALPPLDTCADVEALTAAIPPPEDPELRARVQQHRETLARAEVLETTGQTAQGLELVERVLADTASLTHEPLLAEAYLRKGSLQMYVDAKSALAAFNAALSTALKIGHTRVAAHASARRGFVLAEQLQRAKEAQEDLLWVSPLNQRIEKDVTLYKDHLISAGVVLARAGDAGTAKALLREAMTLAGKPGQETMQDLNVLNNLGNLMHEEHSYEEALRLRERVLNLSEQLFGGLQVEKISLENNRASELVAIGQPNKALNILHKSEQAFGNDIQHAVHLFPSSIAHAESRLGDFASAWRRLVDVQNTDPELLSVEVLGNLTYYAARVGDIATMEKAHAAAMAGLEQNNAAEGSVSVNWGRALAALGRHDEAIDVLERTRAARASSDRLTDHILSAECSLELGRSRQALGQYDLAEREFMAALAGYQQWVPPQNLERADVMLALGELALARQQVDQAADWLTQAESIYTTTAEPDYPPLTRTRAALAQLPPGTHAAPAPRPRAG